MGRHPVVGDFALAFAISWGAVLALLAGTPAGADANRTRLLIFPLMLTGPSTLVLLAVVGGLGAGFFEELGWSGFATPRLLQRHGAVVAGLITGSQLLLWPAGPARGSMRWYGWFAAALCGVALAVARLERIHARRTEPVH